MKEKRKKSWFRRSLFVISCLLLFWSCYELYSIFSEYNKGKKEYDQIRDSIKNQTPTWTYAIPEVETGEENSEENTDGKNDNDTELEINENIIGLEDIDMSAYEVQGKVEAEPGLLLYDLIAVRYNLVDFETLHEINPDVVGWITIEGTNIDYPVLQAEDNEYYLRKTITGQFNMAGSIFVDYIVENPFYSENTLIHGHNQRNNAMFHDLSNYTKKEYLDAHKYILIYLPNGKCITYEIYSFYISDSVSITYDCSYEGNEYEQYLNYTLESSWYDMGIHVTTADKILTLSTCTNGWEDERYVVHARKIS